MNYAGLFFSGDGSCEYLVKGIYQMGGGQLREVLQLLNKYASGSTFVKAFLLFLDLMQFVQLEPIPMF